MTDEELRALVRDAVARHLGSEAGGQTVRVAQAQRARSDPAWRDHPSFGKFLQLESADDGACLIEPAVQCTHCGFCQSFGH